MTLIPYRPQKFAVKTMKLITTANGIIDSYLEQGYRMTLRQLFYQLVASNYFENSERKYNQLSETMSNARLAGLVSWDAIHDKTRFIRKNNHWDGPDGHFDFLGDAKRWFGIDMWANQEVYLEVLIEKDALLGVVERPCSELDVPYMSCRGYMSQSEEWELANRFEEAYYAGKRCILIYLGDHDPSGLDMTRDHEDRLEMFLGAYAGIEVEVRRIALNIDQVHEFRPPPNPTKPKDSRSPEYVKRFGRTCWELDALRPNVLDKLIRDEIDKYRDPDLWQEKLDEFEAQSAKLNHTIHLGIEAFKDEQRRAQESARGD